MSMSYSDIKSFNLSVLLVRDCMFREANLTAFCFWGQGACSLRGRRLLLVPWAIVSTQCDRVLLELSSTGIGRSQQGELTPGPEHWRTGAILFLKACCNTFTYFSMVWGGTYIVQPWFWNGTQTLWLKKMKKDNNIAHHFNGHLRSWLRSSTYYRSQVVVESWKSGTPFKPFISSFFHAI